MEPVYFAAPEEFRAWLEANHEVAPELIVGYFKKGSGRPSMTWPESVDQALCFGWIDGIGRGIDDERYCIRFTPRRTRSIWSARNIRRFGELDSSGLAMPTGRAAFAARREDRSAIYSHEQDDPAVLTSEGDARFRASSTGWEYFAAQAPSYRKAAIHWVTSAKRPETRERRLDRLIASCEAGEQVPPLRRPQRGGFPTA
jgi:uncharacterized protein YdeI (YjbR/CyaY-like superfamily)